MLFAAAALAPQKGGANAQSEKVLWRVGETLDLYLDRPETVYWPETPLKVALMRLSTAHRVAIVLDRRVDPSQTVDFAAQDVPLGEALERFAEQEGLGLSRVGPVLYLGPKETADRLRTVCELKEQALSRMPAETRKALGTRRAMQWPDFSSPRLLAVAMAGEADLLLVQAERIPHDLWARVDLPALSLSNRLTLLAAQFHLMYVVSPEGRRLAFVPIPDDVAVVRSYPLEGSGEEQITRYQEAAPACDFKIDGPRLLARGRSEELRAIEHLREPNRRPRAAVESPPASLELKRFTATVENQPLREVLEKLCVQLHLELDADWEACRRGGVDPDQLISFEVRQADVDALFRAILISTGLRFTRRGTAVSVAPRP